MVNNMSDCGGAKQDDGYQVNKTNTNTWQHKPVLRGGGSTNDDDDDDVCVIPSIAY